MSRTRGRVLLLGACFMASVAPALADEESQWDVSGNVGLQMRYFTQDPLWPGQDPSKLQFSLSGEAEFRWRSKEGNQRASLQVRAFSIKFLGTRADAEGGGYNAGQSAPAASGASDAAPVANDEDIPF